MKSPLCDDKSLLTGYLYGECDPAERQIVEEHLAACASCASELEQLRGVRVALREWAPPEQALGFRLVRDGADTGRVIRPRLARWMPARLPAWAQAAAAVLVIALGAGIANLDLRVGNVAIRTGWHQVVQAPAPQAQAQAGVTVSRADLDALAQQLRQEIASVSPAAAPAVGGSTAAVRNVSASSTRLAPDDFRRVQTIVDDMERRKQHEFDQQLAERFLRFTRDMNSQRAADLRVIQQGLSQMDVRTTELGRVQNYMLRVANVQEIK
jgi:anti-sigma factor RsiW